MRGGGVGRSSARRRLRPARAASTPRAHLFLLVGPLEVEERRILPHRHVAAGDRENFGAAADGFRDSRVGVERVARLVDVHRDHRLPHLDGAAVRFLLPHDHAEQGRLADAVRPDDADDRAGRHRETHPVEQGPPAVGLAQVGHLDDDVAEAGAGGNRDGVQGVGRPRRVRGRRHEVLVLALPRPPLLGLPFGIRPHEFQLGVERARQVGRGAGFRLAPRGAAREPLGVVAFKRQALAPVELQDPAGHVVQEVAAGGEGGAAGWWGGGLERHDRPASPRPPPPRTGRA